MTLTTVIFGGDGGANRELRLKAEPERRQLFFTHLYLATNGSANNAFLWQEDQVMLPVKRFKVLAGGSGALVAAIELADADEDPEFVSEIMAKFEELGIAKV